MAADELSSSTYRPAKGLLRLTWHQIQKIDVKISSLCGLTEETGGEAYLILVVRNGKVRFASMTQPTELLEPAHP